MPRLLQVMKDNTERLFAVTQTLISICTIYDFPNEDTKEKNLGSKGIFDLKKGQAPPSSSGKQIYPEEDGKFGPLIT